VYVIVYEKTKWGTTPVNPTEYRALKSLTFAPETDITLSSIPVCEFTVEIITTDNITTGHRIRLYPDGQLTTYADYRIMKAERIADNIVRVLAQSELALLDTWTLKALRVTGSMGIQTIMEWAENPTYIKSGTPKHITYILASDVLDRDARVTGFFPEQTARERLQQMCITCGLTVQQWFCTGLLLTRVNEVGQIPAFPTSTLIPASDTFFRPERQYVEPAGSLAVWSYGQWTTSEPEVKDDWTVEVTDDVLGTTWYCRKFDGYEDLNEDNDEGKPVEISDVMIINADNVSGVYERKWRFFIAEEYTVDVINNGQYYPGMPVAFYYDTDGDLSNAVVIPGIITKCDFTFGVQNRSKLTIARIPGSYYSDRPVYRVRVHYVYPYTVDGVDKTLALGRNDYYAPAETLVSLDLSTIYVDVVGDTLAFIPDTDDPDYITGIRVNDHDEELTIKYKREAS